MKRHRWLLAAAALLFLFAASASAGGKVTAELHETGWTWEEKNIAAFEGNVSSSEPLPEKIVLQLSFTASPEDSDPGEVVFSAVNGKKLTLRKQRPEITLETEGNSSISFSGSWKTPENVLFTKVEVTLKAYGEDGTTLLAETRMAVTRNEMDITMKDDGRFRIRENYSVITKIIAWAAAAVWAAAVVRIILNLHKKSKER